MVITPKKREYAYAVDSKELEGMEPMDAYSLGKEIAGAFHEFASSQDGFWLYIRHRNLNRIMDMCKQGRRTLETKPTHDGILCTVGFENSLPEEE